MGGNAPQFVQIEEEIRALSRYSPLKDW